MLRFIDFIKRKKKESEEDDYTLLIVDGHNSRLNPDTIFTAAINWIFTAAINWVIVFIDPSNLIHCWQAHDAGSEQKV